MRKSSFFIILMSVEMVLLIGLGVHAAIKTDMDSGRIAMEGELVKSLGITDLCLFTEASYTRHLSQSDLNTAFQDSPMALEHFPSGSFLAPPKPFEFKAGIKPSIQELGMFAPPKTDSPRIKKS